MTARFRPMETEGRAEPKGFDDFDLRLGDMLRGERATLGKSLLDVQRELKIKATYIAAIENADPGAFETPGFVAGYVRSYARYLGLDPDRTFRTFCEESGFATAHGMSRAASFKRPEAERAEGSGDPFGEMSISLAPQRESLLSRIEPGAIGSLAVLLGLVGLIGYGGYAVLKEVQRVQFVPVEQAPRVVADIDPLTSAMSTMPELDEGDPLASAAPDRFDRLYRPEALDVPVMVARDGPIATLDPRRMGALAGFATEPRDPFLPGRPQDVGDMRQTVLAALDAAGAEPAQAPDPQVLADSTPEVVIFAVRPSWVRVRSADGTTIYEKTMNEGDRFVLPKTEEPATLRTGESGAIYFSIAGEPHGPAGRPGSVTGNLPLDAASLRETYDVADIATDTALARVVVELRADPPRLPGQSDAEARTD